MKEPNHLSEIHRFRGLAIIIIVSSHILYFDQSSIFFKVISSIYLNSTLFFAFISGFLFQHLLKKYKYDDYLWRKLILVVLPYLIISIPALSLRLFKGPSYMAQHNWPEIGEQSIITQLLYYLSNGSHLIPLWYIPVITIFFIGAPIFKLIDNYPKWYWLLVPFLVLSLVLYRDPFNINDIPRMAGHFLFIYLFGMFFSHYKSNIETVATKYHYYILALSLIVFGLTLIPNLPFYYQIIFLGKIVFIFPILSWMKHLKSKFVTNMFSHLANNSFGIYFIHFYLLLGLRFAMQKLTSSEYPDNFIIWILSLAFTISISHAIVLLLKKILGKNSRLIIGS